MMEAYLLGYLASVLVIAGLTQARRVPEPARGAFTVWCQPMIGICVGVLTAREVLE